MSERITHWLDAYYSNRLNRISARLFTFIAGLLYSAYSARFATQVDSELGKDVGGLATCFAVVNWFGFILLGRTLFFDRIALVVGALAGFFWFFVGDAIALPFWAGMMAMLVHLYRDWRRLSTIHVLYLLLMILSVSLYRQIYDYSAHPVYLGFFALLFVGYLLYAWSLKMAARKHDAQLAILAAAEKAQQTAAEADQLLAQRIARLEKKRGLPAPLLAELAQITASARQILQCMSTDKRDEVPGRRFLDRYLPGVEMIVTQGQTLSEQLLDAQQRQKSVEDQLEMMRRLKSAFHQQHQALLENDTDDLNSELKTLDKLLKTDGYVK
ncbi:5-bromo-4-chloroindolyl phosphate hydrolysis family protein [Kosakonia sp. BK9b]|uniref:5-bromo-4-chloroindolyl phosphate hydrolysis family protein n=1 Tax=Kosakonia sp. TaxID=1916651 RepID=UPI0028A07C9C|nr:5-bromo-4-chloroindolyl phosphate hydrolysis family protein [Kosakonia sp.]